MTLDEELKAIEERANAATPGPWEVDHRFDRTGDEYEALVISSGALLDNQIAESRVFDDERDILDSQESDDFDFIAASRTDVPRLVAALRLAIESRYDGRTRSEVEVAILRALRGEE